MNKENEYQETLPILLLYYLVKKKRYLGEIFWDHMSQQCFMIGETICPDSSILSIIFHVTFQFFFKNLLGLGFILTYFVQGTVQILKVLAPWCLSLSYTLVSALNRKGLSYRCWKRREKWSRALRLPFRWTHSETEGKFVVLVQKKMENNDQLI